MPHLSASHFISLFPLPLPLPHKNEILIHLIKPREPLSRPLPALVFLVFPVWKILLPDSKSSLKSFLATCALVSRMVHRCFQRLQFYFIWKYSLKGSKDSLKGFSMGLRYFKDALGFLGGVERGLKSVWKEFKLWMVFFWQKEGFLSIIIWYIIPSFWYLLSDMFKLFQTSD